MQYSWGNNVGLQLIREVAGNVVGPSIFSGGAMIAGAVIFGRHAGDDRNPIHVWKRQLYPRLLDAFLRHQLKIDQRGGQQLQHHGAGRQPVGDGGPSRDLLRLARPHG